MYFFLLLIKNYGFFSSVIFVKRTTSIFMVLVGMIMGGDNIFFLLFTLLFIYFAYLCRMEKKMVLTDFNKQIKSHEND